MSAGGMGIILPGEQGAKPEAPKEENKKPPFRQRFEDDGTMVIEVHIPSAVMSQDMLYTMRGFIDSMRDQALGIVAQERARLAKEKAGIVKVNNKGMMQGFLNSIRRK